MHLLKSVVSITRRRLRYTCRWLFEGFRVIATESYKGLRMQVVHQEMGRKQEERQKQKKRRTQGRAPA